MAAIIRKIASMFIVNKACNDYVLTFLLWFVRWNPLFCFLIKVKPVVLFEARLQYFGVPTVETQFHLPVQLKVSFHPLYLYRDIDV